MGYTRSRRLVLLAATLTPLALAAACGEDDPTPLNLFPAKGSGGTGGTGGAPGGAGGSGGAPAGSGGTSAGGSAGSAPAPRWRVDPTFGDQGRLDVGDLGASYAPLAAAALPDGGFVVLNRDRGWLSRFSPEGRRDDAFGWDGVLTLAFSSLVPEALFVTRDGQIVVGGRSSPFVYPPRGFVARITDRGELDLEFGTDGFAEVLEDPHRYLSIAGLAEQPDGKLVGAGYEGFDEGFVTFRLTRDGALDPSFNTTGVFAMSEVQLQTGQTLELWSPHAVFPTLDGTLIVAGLGVAREGDFTSPFGTDFVLLGEGAFGNIDGSFGSAGAIAADAGPASSGDVGPDAFANQCLVAARLADGRIVIAGERGDNYPDWVVRRYLPDGTPDPSFVGGGFFAYTEVGVYKGAPQDCTLVGLDVAPDGSVLLAGHAERGVELDGSRGLLLRLLPDGTPDPSFGEGGLLWPALSIPVDIDGDGMPDDQYTEPSQFSSLTPLGGGSYLVGVRVYTASGYDHVFFRLLPP